MGADVARHAVVPGVGRLIPAIGISAHVKPIIGQAKGIGWQILWGHSWRFLHCGSDRGSAEGSRWSPSWIGPIHRSFIQGKDGIKGAALPGFAGQLPFRRHLRECPPSPVEKR
jgi:hypothetical protein